MRKPFKHKTGFWLIVTVVVISIAIGIFNAATDVTFIEDAAQIVFTPVQKLFTNISEGVSGVFGYFSDKEKLHEEIDRLKSENAELKVQINENVESKKVRKKTNN